MNYFMDILEDAAKYHLMVNFHGATIPRGWQRTYPHMMSVEGVYGAEWYNNKEVLTDSAAWHNCTLPFTRNVVGPMDYTPCTFTDSQHPHLTSNGHELALLVVLNRPFNTWPTGRKAIMPSRLKYVRSSLLCPLSGKIRNCSAAIRPTMWSWLVKW